MIQSDHCDRMGARSGKLRCLKFTPDPYGNGLRELWERSFVELVEPCRLSVALTRQTLLSLEELDLDYGL